MTDRTNPTRHAVKNYVIIDEQQAVLPLTNREVFFNFSVYESLKVKAGRILFFEDHVTRLFDSARRLRIIHSFDGGLMRNALVELLRLDEVKDATVRIQLVGGEEPVLFMFLQTLPHYTPQQYAQGVATISYVGERIEPEVKSNCLLLNYLALRSAQDSGAFEALLVDRHKMVMEGTRSNVFAIRKDVLFTPGTGILEGVTRKHLLRAATELGMGICYSDLPLRDILDGGFDELFISSTSMGAMPVATVDGIPVSRGFSRTHELHKALCRIEAS